MAANIFDKLNKEIDNNKLSHAYLIETNNCDACLNDLKFIIKRICCQNEYSSNCDKCNICHLIDNDSFPNYILVKNEGSTIKKSQIVELKRKLDFKPLYSDNNVYVIQNVEKLNSSSSNTMLKMIEEPEENIYCFLLTNNKENVLSTIQSRCELLKINYSNIDLFSDLGIYGDEKDKYLDVLYKYLEKIEEEKKLSIYYNKSILLKNISDKSDIEKFFKIMFDVYDSYFRKKSGLSFNEDYNQFNFLEKNTIKNLEKKVNIIAKCINDMNINFNLDLFLDKFIIEMGEVDG